MARWLSQRPSSVPSGSGSLRLPGPRHGGGVRLPHDGNAKARRRRPDWLRVHRLEVHGAVPVSVLVAGERAPGLALRQPLHLAAARSCGRRSRPAGPGTPRPGSPPSAPVHFQGRHVGAALHHRELLHVALIAVERPELDRAGVGADDRQVAQDRAVDDYLNGIGALRLQLDPPPEYSQVERRFVLRLLQQCHGVRCSPTGPAR